MAIPHIITLWPPQWPGWMTVLGPPGPGQGPLPHGLELGDVLVTAPVVPDYVDGAIYSAQQLVFAIADAAFTHAAIYVGNGLIVDSMPGVGIALRPFQDLIQGAHFRALRLDGIGPAKQWDIADAAINLQGKYSYVQGIADALIQITPLSLPWKTMLADIAAHAARGKSYYYCSQFVNEAYVRAIQVGVTDSSSAFLVPLPAAFSASARFSDVDIYW